MSRRLSLMKRCAVCGDVYRPFTTTSLVCSRRCSAIRRVKLHPDKHRMIEANRANAEQARRELSAKLAGLTLEQAYRKGYERGWMTAHQKWQRITRRAS